MATIFQRRKATNGRRRNGHNEAGRYLNRELSWLDFNERVLAFADDPRLPLLERGKFLAICASNLDEFFQIRVAGLKRQEAAGQLTRSTDGMSAGEQLAEIGTRVRDQADRHARVFAEVVRPGLAVEGVPVVRWKELSETAQTELRQAYTEQIFPVLTPLAVDPGHPFPYISNLSLNLAVLVKDNGDRRRLFARIKVPPLLPRFMSVDREDGQRVWVPLEEVISANLDTLFPGMTVADSWAFRVTRHSDLEIDDDEAEDLLETIEEELRRLRFTRAVRLEVETGMPDHVIALLTRELQISRGDVHELPGPLGLVDLWSLYALERPDLKSPPFFPITPRILAPTPDGPTDIFGVLRTRDVLVHHPYDSFAGTVQAFIEQAAADPSVLAIKQTLYRTSGESPIVDALVQAAGEGKQVVVLVELKARLDEQANIAWAKKLEQAGCHVVYGLVGLKTHCKVVPGRPPGGDRRAALRPHRHGQLQPDDRARVRGPGLLTSDEKLAADVTHLFNVLTGYSRRSDYESLIVAPLNLRRRMVGDDRARGRAVEARQAGAHHVKMNALVDDQIVDALYAASRRACGST